MSDAFGDILGDVSAALGDQPIDRSLFAPIARIGISEGLSANAILRGLSDAGIGIRRSEGLSVIRDILAQNRLGIYVPPQDYRSYPDRNQIVQVGQGREGTYRYQMQVEQRVRTETGEYFTESRTFSIGSDSLITVGEAVQIANDVFAEHSTSYEDREVLGVEFRGVIQNMGPRWQ